MTDWDQMVDDMGRATQEAGWERLRGEYDWLFARDERSA